MKKYLLCLLLIISLNVLIGMVPDTVVDINDIVEGSVSIRPIGDITGDGYDDILFFVNREFHPDGIERDIALFAGNSLFEFSPSPLYSLPDTTGVIREISNIGDINNDGFNDFALGQPSFMDISRAFIYHGCPTLNFEEPAYVYSSISHDVGGFIIGLGDWNDDGHDDYVISGVKPL